MININEQIESRLKLLERRRYFPLCLNESTDITAVRQYIIFGWIIDEHFCINEELLTLLPPHLSRKGVNIFNPFRKVEVCRGFNKYSVIITDWAPSIIEKENGLKGLLTRKTAPIAQHCILHQDVSCAKIKILNYMTKIVTKITNLIIDENKA